MSKPLLQIALDSVELETALLDAANIAAHVDIIEVGTVLAFSKGSEALDQLRALYPKHILVCDMKLLDAGETLAHMAFEHGANYITVGAAAHIATVQAAKAVADEFNGEVQIELFGKWDMDDAKAWLDSGITQAIYHRSKDAQSAGQNWSEQDLKTMSQLSELGFELSITGGIVPEDIHLFKNINAKAFIAGRALANKDGISIAKHFHQEIEKYW